MMYKKVDPQEVTCGQFASWLHNYLLAVSRDNGIGWCHASRAFGDDPKYTESYRIEEDTHTLWPMVFIQPGMNEGDIITVAVSGEAGKYDTLCRIKVFASEDKLRELGPYCHNFLVNFLWSHEIPWVTDLMDKVSSGFKYQMEKYSFDYRDESLYLLSAGREILLGDSIPSELVEDYIQDARRALNNYRFTEVPA